MKIGVTSMLLAASLVIPDMAFGQSTTPVVGAPTSAAGAVPQAAPLRPLPPVARPRAAGSLGGSTSSSIRARTPGTGKYDGRSCVGSSGFGSSRGVGGRRC